VACGYVRRGRVPTPVASTAAAAAAGGRALMSMTARVACGTKHRSGLVAAVRRATHCSPALSATPTESSTSVRVSVSSPRQRDLSPRSRLLLVATQNYLVGGDWRK